MEVSSAPVGTTVAAVVVEYQGELIGARLERHQGVQIGARTAMHEHQRISFSEDFYI